MNWLVLGNSGCDGWKRTPLVAGHHVSHRVSNHELSILCLELSSTYTQYEPSFEVA
jgi:hypothetical protein